MLQATGIGLEIVVLHAFSNWKTPAWVRWIFMASERYLASIFP
jgi:hypothetical protein